MAASRRSTRPSLISQVQSHGRSAAEDMMELGLTRAALRRGSHAKPNDGLPPRAVDRRGYLEVAFGAMGRRRGRPSRAAVEGSCAVLQQAVSLFGLSAPFLRPGLTIGSAP